MTRAQYYKGIAEGRIQLKYEGEYKGINLFTDGFEHFVITWRNEVLHGTSLPVIKGEIDDGGIFIDAFGNVHARNEDERLEEAAQ